MKRTSEYVSPGHPDKIADYISSYILDRYLEKDKDTKYALEVQIKDFNVTLGGEVSSTHQFSKHEIEFFVRNAVNEIGYTEQYMDRWGHRNTICGMLLAVTQHINQQSPEISQGLNGWGDQGIFFGYSTFDESTHGMPMDHVLAKYLCRELFNSGLGGLDIKTQVSVDSISELTTDVVVAIPLIDHTVEEVEDFVHAKLPGDYTLIVNGTGKYVQHSSIADCGTTGRKLVVDFYGSGCQIGGGSPWTKDGSKADLTLNLAARKLAKLCAYANKRTIYTSMNCCIGRQEVGVTILDSQGNVWNEDTWKINPKELIEEFRLDTPIYTSMCKWGLFGEFQSDKAWESTEPFKCF